MSSKGKTKSPAFQFYAQDWLSSVDILLMTIAEEGAYHRLLCWAWTQDDCGLPSDDASLAHLSRLGRHWSRSRETILKKFRLESGRYYNDRLLQEKSKQTQVIESASEAGKASWAKRRHKQINELLTPEVNDRSTTVQRPLNSSFSSSISTTVISSTDHECIASDSPLENSACGAFLKIFTGEKPSGTFQQFLASVPSGDIQICLSHTALWMNTPKYQTGYGKDAVQFLKQGIWKHPPPNGAVQPNGKKPSLAEQAKEYEHVRQERIRSRSGSR